MARVEDEGLFKIGNAFIPVSLASGDQGESGSGVAAALQEFVDAPEGGFGKLTISQHIMLIITQREQSVGRVRLKLLRIVQGSFRVITASGTGVDLTPVKKCIRPTKSAPGERKSRIKLDRLFIGADGFLCWLIREASCIKS